MNDSEREEREYAYSIDSMARCVMVAIRMEDKRAVIACRMGGPFSSPRLQTDCVHTRIEDLAARILLELYNHRAE